MAEWEYHLVGQALRPEYDTVVSSGRSNPFHHFIRDIEFGDVANSWIAGQADGRVFFGRWGWVDEAIGTIQKHSSDPRRGAYFLGYSAPAGTALPRHSDLHSLEQRVKVDLRMLWDRVSAVGRSLECPHEILPAKLSDYSATPLRKDQWDEAIASIQNLESKALAILSPSGEVWRKDILISESLLTGESKKKFFSNMYHMDGLKGLTPKHGTTIAVLAGIGFVGLSGAALMLWSDRDKRRNEDRPVAQQTHSL
jgi:hypothetical protein